MRRTDRQITDLTEICNILDRCDTIRLGLQGADYPYVVPLSFGWEEQDGKISVYFHSAMEGHKLDCIARDDRVCVEASRFLAYVGLTTRYESVIGFGHAVRCTGDEAIHGLNLLLAHCGSTGYDAAKCSENLVTQVCRVDLEQVTGKRCR